MYPKLIIFDLDGTLIDTIADLGDAVSFALAKRGLKTHSEAEYTQMVGHGIRNLNVEALTKSLGYTPTDALVDECLKDFVDYYVEHIDVHTRPYEGIPELLRGLQAEGIRLAVASNKFQEGAERLIEEFFPDIDFVAVLGNSPRFPLKPDAEVVRYITGLAGVGASETVFVGDSTTDIKTAINGGVRSIGVTWGFRPESDLVAAGADEIVHKPDQIREVL